MFSLLTCLSASALWHFAAPAALAYRPFLDPLALDRPWLVLAAPMVLAVAVVYKAIKLDDLSHLPRHALAMAAQVLVLMAIAAALLWALTELM